MWRCNSHVIDFKTENSPLTLFHTQVLSELFLKPFWFQVFWLISFPPTVIVCCSFLIIFVSVFPPTSMNSDFSGESTKRFTCNHVEISCAFSSNCALITAVSSPVTEMQLSSAYISHDPWLTVSIISFMNMRNSSGPSLLP